MTAPQRASVGGAPASVFAGPRELQAAEGPAGTLHWLHSERVIRT
jgi:hypothetical protein